ncbi:hypothetical protein Hte_010359 [Hypoxylon texense]
MSQTVVLISGATRGLGKGLLELYFAKPNHVVIAANSDPKHPTSEALYDLPKGAGSSLIIVKVDATVESDAAAAVQILAARGIAKIDLVIANAGVFLAYGKVSEIKTSDLQANFVPNVCGMDDHVHITRPYLLTFFENQPPFPNTVYAPTKTVAHWLTERMNGEADRLADFVVDPGFCETGVGGPAARALGLERAPLDVEVSSKGLVPLIDGATKETRCGRFWSYEGHRQPW